MLVIVESRDTNTFPQHIQYQGVATTHNKTKNSALSNSKLLKVMQNFSIIQLLSFFFIRNGIF